MVFYSEKKWCEIEDLKKMDKNTLRQVRWHQDLTEYIIKHATVTIDNSPICQYEETVYCDGGSTLHYVLCNHCRR